MDFKKKIAKILNLKTQSGLQPNINGYWVYKLTVEQVSLVFDANFRGCFGFYKERNFNTFLLEYNQLFNSGNKQLENNIFRTRLFLKHMKLQAMYNSLLYSKGINAKKEFVNIFGYDYTEIKDLKRVTDENNRILDKLKIISKPMNGETIAFSDLVVMVETSRKIPIDRDMKLWEFKKVYDLELKKWQQT